MRDYYYTLGVGEGCTPDEIKEAYRKLSKKFHPDLNPGDGYFENRYLEIQDAYDTLSDPDGRTRYDIELKKFKSGYIKSYHSPRYGPTDQRFQNRPYKFKSRRPGIGIIITLILLAIIFGVYGIKYFNHSKAPVITPVAVVNAPVYHTRKKHKKHNLANKTAGVSVKHNFDTTKTAKNKQIMANQPLIKPPIIKPVKPMPDTVRAAHPEKPYLYATYIHPNQTGVVNLRQTDNFNSTVIQVIPANVRVLVLQRGDTYYKVNFHNNIGYVPKWSLESE